MADRARTALGLSIGATNLAAVAADVAMTRKPVLTLYRQRPPEVGIPSENPRLDEPGVVVSDFVDRVGDPAGIVAADGSVHRSEALVADGLRALAFAATGGRPLPDNVAVTYPAHWPAPSVDAMAAALGRVSEWSNRARPPLLIPDAAAALCAVRTSPGLPAEGTVAVCDFGGSGTSITLINAGADFAVAPTVRHHDFSGDMIDQALLTAVMAGLPTTAPFDPSGASAVGSLSRLRGQCRGAKEQLSSSAVTTVGDIRLTRNELDDAIRGMLHNFVAVLDEALQRNGIGDLVAVVSMGGGANLPVVTTMLSVHLRIPVVTTPRPQLAAAVGASLRAAQGPDGPTGLIPVSAPVVPATAPVASATAEAPALGAASWRAWPQGRTLSSPAMPVGATATIARPALKSAEPAQPDRPATKRRHLVLIAGASLALLLAGGAVAIGLASGDREATTPGVSTTPAAPAMQQPPPPPSATAEPPAPPATQEATVAPKAAPADEPAPAAKPAPALRPIPAIPRIPAIPELPPLPPIPGINEPIPGLPEIPTLISQLGPG